jgi:hypothetical protein
MGKAVKLSNDLVESAELYAQTFSRSTPRQIEHWAKIGKIAEENPDLSYEMIKSILLAQNEINDDKREPYSFG